MTYDAYAMEPPADFASIAICPDCVAPGYIPDPLAEHMQRCSAHPAGPLTGSADGDVTRNEAWVPWAQSEGEASTCAPACALIHRGRPEPEAC